ncbi:sensitivity to high expression protein she9 [Mortierella claussenii]|nr:sensitivity to high expression protein she9 [Mortierella claussenii]
MSAHFRLIRPTGSLTVGQAPLLCPSSLRTQLFNSRSGPPVNLLLARREFSVSFSGRSSEDNRPKTLAGKDKASRETVEETTQRKLAEDTERKRVAAQDAALKEILDSAAAEKKKLEEEAIKVAREKERQAAESAAAARAKEAAEKEAAEKLRWAQSTPKTVESKPSIEHCREDVVSPQGLTGSSSATKASQDSSPSRDPKAMASSIIHQDATLSTKQQESNSKGTVPLPSSVSGEDPLKPLKARLLPYKKSIESSTEYIRAALPDSLRQLSESVKRKDYRDTIAQLSEHLNNFTGYNSINELKSKVITHGDSLDEARIKLAQAKQAYEDAISTRSETQKAINDLLQRKHLWSPDDVIRFTDLYRSEHANEQAELKTKMDYKQAESNVESKSRMLTRVIMERYHEEQVWSDKIRAASTYGTWGLVGVNVMAFLIVQAFVEPRRRRKQVERYEELVQDLTERGILPHKVPLEVAASGAQHGPSTSVATGSQPPSTSDSASVSGAASVAVMGVGGALMGGEDVLLKIVKSAERQEERLDRMENLLLKQNPGALDNKMSEVIVKDVQDSPEIGEYVLEENGAVVFITDADKASEIDMGDAWREGLVQSAADKTSQSRLSLILSDGEAEVRATRRDFLLSSLGGAVIGGILAVAVMLNK